LESPHIAGEEVPSQAQKWKCGRELHPAFTGSRPNTTKAGFTKSIIDISFTEIASFQKDDSSNSKSAPG